MNGDLNHDVGAGKDAWRMKGFTEPKDACDYIGLWRRKKKTYIQFNLHRCTHQNILGDTSNKDARREDSLSSFMQFTPGSDSAQLQPHHQTRTTRLDEFANLPNLWRQGCAAPGIRFQGFYVLFMHAYRRMPFIVPSLHNSQEKLSCKLTSDLAIKKKVLRNESRAVKLQPAGYADPAK